jgi:hypothetical protein
MYAIVSAAIRERSSTSPSLPTISGKENNTAHHDERERVPAPSRFAAAQQLFRRQQTVPPKPPSPPFIAPKPTSPTRHRSFTASSSLYSTLAQSIQADSPFPEESTTQDQMSSPESFGQPKPKHTIHPPQHDQTPETRLQPPLDPSCILPGPKHTSRPFDITSIKGTTTTGRPAWYCRHDKLVVFDGLAPSTPYLYGRHDKRLLVRTSKGLEMARKNCPKETIEVEIKCAHCRDALGMGIWKYEVRVRKGGVCEGCRRRCWGLVEGSWEEESGVAKEVEAAASVEASADSPKEGDKGKVGDDGRRDSFLMLGEEEKGVRKVKSERNLKAEALFSPIGEVAESGLMNELRKVRSDQQLQPRPPTTTTSLDSILFTKPPL